MSHMDMKDSLLHIWPNCLQLSQNKFCAQSILCS